MEVWETTLAGVVVVEPRVFADQRGFFLETWNQAAYAAAGLGYAFVQDNLSLSRQGVLRGLHYQHPHGQGKLVSVLSGAVFDVAVDIRRGSPSFGRWVGVCLSSENHRQLFIPAGFAHGFVVTSPDAIFIYKCTSSYRPEAEHGIRWDDPSLAIQWPVQAPILSPKDAGAPLLADIPEEDLPAAS
ncbi:MAG TPA: dTDP-4-dehydrorhamnose 3,5-epimerase [Thermomicrobiaceae bacterium]|nr:dTDP-4-dehydrorhamnose 3,5-epimerase [Thermomicrobiaceae bacterium]